MTRDDCIKVMEYNRANMTDPDTIAIFDAVIRELYKTPPDPDDVISRKALVANIDLLNTMDSIEYEKSRHGKATYDKKSVLGAIITERRKLKKMVLRFPALNLEEKQSDSGAET